MSSDKKEKKITSIVIVLLVIGLVIGAIIGYSAESGQVSSLHTQIASLQANNTELQGQVSAIQVNLTQLSSQVSSLQADKANLQSQVSSLEVQIANLTSKKTTVVTVTEIKQDILGMYFSPNGGCAAQVIYWIGRANSSIDILIYSFTLNDVGDAILSSYQKGINIRIVFDRSQNSEYSEYFRLADAGVQARNSTIPSPGVLHDKVMIIDGHVILTGSFNWSNEAESKNDENLIVIDSASLAAVYERVFDRIWATGR